VGVALVGFLSGAFGVLVLPGHDVPFPPPVALLALALGVGAGGAAAFVSLLLITRRVRGAERDLVLPAIARGALPEGVDRVRMRNALQSRADVLASWRWLWPVMTAVQLLTGVPRVLDPSETPYSRVFWAIAVVFWVCVGIGLPLRSRRERPIVRRLLDELDRPREAEPTRTD